MTDGNAMGRSSTGVGGTMEPPTLTGERDNEEGNAMSDTTGRDNDTTGADDDSTGADERDQGNASEGSQKTGGLGGEGTIPPGEDGIAVGIGEEGSNFNAEEDPESDTP